MDNVDRSHSGRVAARARGSPAFQKVRRPVSPDRASSVHAAAEDSMDRASLVFRVDRAALKVLP